MLGPWAGGRGLGGEGHQAWDSASYGGVQSTAAISHEQPHLRRVLWKQYERGAV